jgi:hypothetical protein
MFKNAYLGNILIKTMKSICKAFGYPEMSMTAMAFTLPLPNICPCVYKLKTTDTQN